MSDGFEHSVNVQLRWRDMDMLGHLNQSVYHELLEEGRAALMTEIIRRVAVGNSSLTLHHEVRIPDGTVAASGRTVLVAWDPVARGKRMLSDAERAALT